VQSPAANVTVPSVNLGSLTSMVQFQGAREQSIELDALTQQALYFGSNSKYVQGAGGNLSAKTADTMWVKASGTRLKDARDRQVFLGLDLARSKQDVLDTEDLSHLVFDVPGTEELRPSIETAIHSLLPHKYVTHLHSVGAISRAIDNGFDHVKELSSISPALYVPYAKPGIPLARIILSTLQKSHLSQMDSLIIILGNHGIIVAADNAPEIIRLVDAVETAWGTSESLVEPAVAAPEGSWQQIAPTGALNTQQIALLTGGVLTPDQLVFLGEKPFSRARDVVRPATSGLSNVIIYNDGSVFASTNLSNDALEIAQSFVTIARLSRPTCQPSYLSPEDIESLVNWDAEKWRKAQEQ
jgi:ribulose-5-phosphate 4-epimerase/fuculose-1-phosphate aldolase